MSSAGDEFTRLVQIMATLRGPEGCPWDREQTISSLRRYLLEETYEVLEAIDWQNHHGLREELGDFLFQAVFLAQLENEAGHFDIADVIRGVADKLVRRHPHVFARSAGEPALDTPAQVKTRWEEIKTQERAGENRAKTLLSGIPAAQPALLRASQISARAASVGFDWATPGDVVDKIQEEVNEIREVVEAADSAPAETLNVARVEEEMGDLLFAIANLSRKLGVEPEGALRKANDKFTARFTAVERNVEASGRTLTSMTLEELEAEWQQVKHLHKGDSGSNASPRKHDNTKST